MGNATITLIPILFKMHIYSFIFKLELFGIIVTILRVNTTNVLDVFVKKSKYFYYVDVLIKVGRSISKIKT